MENMHVRIEVWPLAADQTGIWLVSGSDAWRPALPVPSDGDIFDEVAALLWARKGGRADHLDTLMLHSTSWRQEGSSAVHTFMAVVDVAGNVLDEWPHAQPVSLALAEAVGPPYPHGAAEAPVPRYIDVLKHGIRHLKFLLDTDDGAAETFTLPWRRHLSKLQPALAGMYRSA